MYHDGGMLLYKKASQQTMYHDGGLLLYKKASQQTIYHDGGVLLYKNEGTSTNYVRCIPCITMISSCERNVRRLDINVLLHNFYEAQVLTRNCIHVLCLLLNTL